MPTNGLSELDGGLSLNGGTRCSCVSSILSKLEL